MDVVTTVEVSASEVGHLYLEMHHRLRKAVDEAMCASGLSLARAKVLGQLTEHGPMKQAMLASRLGIAPRSVTDTLDALERDGLAERRADPADRRAWITEITPAGSKALGRAMSAKYQVMEQIFGALEPQARAALAAQLQAIAASLAPSSSGDCLAE